LGDPVKRFFNGTASAQDVLTIFLKHVRDRCGAVLGQTVELCCVTVPYGWSQEKVRAYLEVLEKAGWKVIPAGPGGIGLFPEPVAAGLNYADDKQLAGSGVNMLIVDIGSTTTDVSYVSMKGSTVEVLGGHGETLGGF